MAEENIEAKRAAVIRFLEDFQSLVKNHRPSIVPRDKNVPTLIQLGLTLTDQWNILKRLSLENYVSGPEPDRDRPGEVWVFGWVEKGVELYIKIKIVEYISAETGLLVRMPKCISFHPSEKCLNYFFKE